MGGGLPSICITFEFFCLGMKSHSEFDCPKEDGGVRESMNDILLLHCSSVGLICQWVQTYTYMPPMLSTITSCGEKSYASEGRAVFIAEPHC